MAFTPTAPKGLGPSRDDAETFGDGSVGKNCPELNHSGQGSSQIITHFWPGAERAEMAPMVADQNYPFPKMIFCSLVLLVFL